MNYRTPAESMALAAAVLAEFASDRQAPESARNDISAATDLLRLGVLAAVACRITEFVFDARDPTALADWRCEVLGYEVLDRDDHGAVEIGPPGQATRMLDDPDLDSSHSVEADQPAQQNQVTLLFLPVPELTPGKLRLHIDVNATDRDQAAELERLLSLGAVRADIGQTGDETWQVLGDPEGNLFCLLASRVAPVRTH